MQLSSRNYLQYFVDHSPLIISFFCFVLMATILSLNIDRGLVLTDDSYYIILARQPQNIDGSISQFGYFTHWLYLAAKESISSFRLLGMLLLVVISLIFAWFYISFAKKTSHSSQNTLTVIFLIASAGMSYYFWRWYPTPSYNWMNLIGCLLVASGLLGFAKPQQDSKALIILSGLLVGLGGALSFFAKPPTAGLLLLIMCWWLHCYWKTRAISLFFISACIPCFSILVWHIQIQLGSVTAFIESVEQGLIYGNALQSGHNLPDISRLVAQGIVLSVTCGVLLSVVFYKLYGNTMFSYKSSATREQIPNRVFLSIASIIVFTLILTPISPGSIPAIAWLTLLVAYLCFYWFIKEQTVQVEAGENPSNIMTFTDLKPILLTLLIAMAYPVGSDWNFEKLLSGGLILLVPACLSFASLYDKYFVTRKYSTITIWFIVITFMLQVYSEYNEPLRLRGSLKEHSIPTTLYAGHDTLLVDSMTAKYVNDLSSAANAAGWERGMPLIDMTGFTTAAFVLLDAKVVGRPWFLGRYDGANDYAAMILSRADKATLTQAWILTALDGYASIDEQVLLKVGLDFPASYSLAGEVVTSYRREVQQLWKPK